jgi:hypothetical protein
MFEDSITALVSAVQAWKAPSPIDVTEEGIVTDSRPVPEKAAMDMVSSPSGRLTEVRAEHPANARCPMLLALEMSADSRLVQPSNALTAMTPTPPMSADGRLVHRQNASSPRVVRLPGKSIVASAEQLQNADAPMAERPEPSGIVTVARTVQPLKALSPIDSAEAGL